MMNRFKHILFLALALPFATSIGISRAEESQAAAVVPESGTCDVAVDVAVAAPEPEGLLGCKTVCAKCEQAGGVCVPVPSGCICS
jgi:hypothetical protein